MGKSLIDDISEARRDGRYRKTYDKRDGLELKARTEAHWKPTMPSVHGSPRVTLTGGGLGHASQARIKARVTLPKVWK